MFNDWRDRRLAEDQQALKSAKENIEILSKNVQLLEKFVVAFCSRVDDAFLADVDKELLSWWTERREDIRRNTERTERLAREKAERERILLEKERAGILKRLAVIDEKLGAAHNADKENSP